FAPGFAQSIAAGDGVVWTTHTIRGLELSRIDVVHDPVEQHATNVPTADVEASNAGVWFLGWGDRPGGVGQIDPATGGVRPAGELSVGVTDRTQLVAEDRAAWVIDSSRGKAWLILGS